MGNVDANNLCLNELGRDVTSVKENVWSLTQKVGNMGQCPLMRTIWILSIRNLHR